MPEIDNISITYSDTVDNIDINYLSTVDNITLSLGSAVASSGGAVDSVNSLTGEVVLTASATLSLTTSSSGYYEHTFTHNLNYQYVDVSLYDAGDRQVIADIFYLDPNYVNIRAAIDLTGYKAVAQR
jgi:hypothetical protein